MKTVLLNDIEVDIHELKLLLNAVEKDPGTPLREVARRRILQIQKSLTELSDSLNEYKTEEFIAPPEQKPEINKDIKQIEKYTVVPETEELDNSPILAENLKISGHLLHAFSINDSFLFSRELFDGDTDKMNRSIRTIEGMDSLNSAVSYLTDNELVNKDNESYADFIEILDKYFSTK